MFDMQIFSVVEDVSRQLSQRAVSYMLI